MDSSFALLFPARRPMTTVYKIPRSVLVVIHTPDLQVLMMQRAGWQDFWQSVTGSLAHESEPLRVASRPVPSRTSRIAAPRRGPGPCGRSRAWIGRAPTCRAGDAQTGSNVSET